MNLSLLFDNLTNPALLFFCLGIFAVQVKSDLEIPATSGKFISLYLLFSIGFNGGQELAHSHFSFEIVNTILFSIALASIIPVYVFFFMKNKLGTENAGAIAAAYGSVSAVTFVTAISFLEQHLTPFDGHMVAILAFMEAPAIIVGVLLIKYFSKNNESNISIFSLVRHAITNGSVLLILGSLVIGYIASDQQANGIKPFTTDLFKGFLAIFLLDMGITSGQKLKSFFDHGWFTTASAVMFALVNGSVVAIISSVITPVAGNRFLLAVLAASASYIAVPAAMKIAVPKANPGIYLPMALAVTFPINITIGLPLYFYFITIF
jgi:uncharacterized protein